MRMPTSITLPENVWIFGAVNMDDTTHQLSHKVLDRVQVVRFRNPMLADWDAIEAEVQEASQNLTSHFGELRMTPEDFEIGRAHVRTPVTNSKLVCSLLLEKKNN